MKGVKLFLSVTAVAGMTALMGAGSAQAGSATGRITKIDDYGSYAYIYITAPSTGSSTSTVSYCNTASSTTNNNQQLMLAAAAKAGNNHIMLWGNGTTTSGYLGTCQWVDTLGLY